MEQPTLLPNPGEVFVDVRGGDRTMRVTHHEAAGVTVVSMWAGRVCRGSFRLASDEIPRLARLLDLIAEPVPDAPTGAAAAPGPDIVAEAS
jgi:hypothetical protein